MREEPNFAFVGSEARGNQLTSRMTERQRETIERVDRSPSERRFRGEEAKRKRQGGTSKRYRPDGPVEAWAGATALASASTCASYSASAFSQDDEEDFE